MPTSSIFANFEISNSEVARKFVDVLCSSSQSKKEKTKQNKTKLLTKEEVADLFGKKKKHD